MTPDQIQAAVDAALQGKIAISWWVYAISLLLPFAGAFLGSYFRKKGENLATKEDFNVLLAQVKKTTHETELIKADISRISWVDQQRWTLKRELYLELLDALHSEREAIFRLHDEAKQELPKERDVLEKRDQFIKDNQAQSFEAIKRITKVRGIAGVMLSDDAQKALDSIAAAWYQSLDRADPKDFYQTRLDAADKAYFIVLKTATTELNVKAPS